MIRKREVKFPDPERHKIFMTEDCKDFITKLLTKDPTQRLGFHGGCDEVLSHPWFSDIDVKKVLAKEIPAPYVPQLSKNLFDVSAFDKEFTGEEAIITMLDN